MPKKIDYGKHVFSGDGINNFLAHIIKFLPYVGITESKFFLCRHDKHTFLVKMCFYKTTKHKPAEGYMMPVDAEIAILTLLRKKIIDANITPCILEIMYYHVYKNLKERVPTDYQSSININQQIEPNHPIKLLCNYYDMVRAGLAVDKLTFIILERCDVTLSEFLKHYIDHKLNFAILKSIIFQLVYTMYALTHVFHDFHHWDLHSDNVMIRFDFDFKFDPENIQYLVFEDKITNTIWTLPYFGVITKIIDFSYSSIASEGILSTAAGDPGFMYYRSTNDLLFTIHNLYTAAKEYNIDDLLELVNELDPHGLSKHYNTEYIRVHHDQVMSYNDMLLIKLFREYKRKPPNKNKVFHKYTLHK